jgi:hypothetical protein
VIMDVRAPGGAALTEEVVLAHGRSLAPREPA